MDNTTKSPPTVHYDTQWATPDPVAVWTKATGLFIPVLPDPNGLFVASVNPDAASGG